MAKREKLNLTDAVANAARPSGVREFIWDVKLTGFGLRIEPSGSRAWVVKYRAEGGGRSAPVRWLTLGACPAMKAKDARNSAAKALGAVRNGADPAGDLAAKRREMTIEQLADFYFENGLVILKGARRGEPMKKNTAAYTKARLLNHLVPLLGKRRVTEITPGDVAKFAKDIAAGRTAKDEKVGPRRRIIVRGGEGAARKLVRDLSAMFTFAIQHRIISENPVATASVRKTDNKRERFLSIDEVKRLGSALNELEAEGMNAKAANITRLWALTGCRRDEIAALCWHNVDFQNGLLKLDDSKTGRSIRPLSLAAIAVLQGLREDAEAGASFVFPAERGERFYQGTKKVWSKVTERAALPGVSPHTLRHTLGGAAASGGEAMLMIGAILGHANARSTQIYAHIDHDPARLAANRATAEIAGALGKGLPVVARPDVSAILAALEAGEPLQQAEIAVLSILLKLQVEGGPKPSGIVDV